MKSIKKKSLKEGVQKKKNRGIKNNVQLPAK
jgi:hypothetical protein